MRVRIAIAMLGLVLALPEAGVAMPWLSGAAANKPWRLYSQTAGHKLFHGVGTVTGVDAASGVVTIDHQAIPGLMDAMVMDYNVSPKSQLAGIKKGDAVEFEVDGKSYTITALRKGKSP